jgi:hypothetical protein
MSSISSATKNETGSTSSETTTKPLKWQATHVKNAFNQSQDALGQAQGATAPDGFVAQFTPEQVAVFQKMMGYGTQTTAGDTGGALSQGGVNAALGGLSDAGTFVPKGGTDYNIGAASQYADNPYMSGMVDAAMRDARRGVSEEALPQVARTAALTGNVNSNRRAISEGILARGLAEKTADVSAGLRGDAYGEGLKLAQTEANASNDATLKAMLARISGGNTAAGVGVDALKAQGDIYDIAGKGVAGQINAAQAPLNEQMASYQFDTNSPFDALNNYYNIIGARNWGGQSNTTGTTNTTQTSTPSTMDTIGKAVSTGGALFGSSGFNWLPSDERLKTDIKPVGKLDNGLTIYSFKYMDYDAVHIGLIAQEVEKVRPEAIQEVLGFKFVNYDLATQPL